VKNYSVKWKALTLKQEHAIRKALLTGLSGWKFPFEEGHECQEKGWMPFYDTVAMAEQAMRELLRLKAKVAKFHAEKAEAYSESFVIEDGPRSDEIFD
jgi:hypothetical protein